MSNSRRKAEIERVREEGRQAFLDGKSIHSNPYRGCSNTHQWRTGYQWAEDEARPRVTAEDLLREAAERFRENTQADYRPEYWNDLVEANAEIAQRIEEFLR